MASITTKPTQNYLMLAAFAGGMSVMALETTVARLLAPCFGTSLLVWTSVLAIIMVALSVGYYVGGRMADKYTNGKGFYKLILFTSLYIALIPLGTLPIIRIALKASDNYAIGTLFLSLCTIIFLVALPFIALGIFIPYIVKLTLQAPNMIGRVSGRVFSWSTIGGILGIFIPTFLTIPTIGTSKSIMIFATLLMLVGIIGLRKWILFILPLITIFLTTSLFKIKPTHGLIFETESAYNYIQVVEESGIRLLRLNEGHAEHSFYEKDSHVVRWAYWNYYLLFGLLNQGKTALSIGLAGGTIAKQYTHFIPGAQVDGIEIDPAIVEVGKRYFGLDSIPGLQIITKDGRLHLATTSKCYDNILMDAYKQPYIPFHLTTKEFFQEAKRHLNDQGIVSINIGSTQPNSPVLLMIQNTMKSVFKHVYSVRVRGDLNYIVWATDYDFDINAVDIGRGQEALGPIINYIKTYAKEVKYDPNYMVLTDDIAPIELYTEKMIIDFASGLAK